jgi:hypothetical protein
MTATAGIKEMAVVMVPMTPTTQASTNWIVRLGCGFSAVMRVRIQAVAWSRLSLRCYLPHAGCWSE